MNEQWLPVVGYEGLYEISDQGRVKFLARVTGDGHNRKERISYGFRIKRGYMAQDFLGKQLLVHQAVMRAFVGPAPDGMEICHNDGDGCNNKLTNLRYDTHASNNRDRVKHNTIPRGEAFWKTKLTERQVLSIFPDKRPIRVIAAEHGVAQPTICDIKKGRSWAWLTAVS